jgi:hypothetical protein
VTSAQHRGDQDQLAVAEDVRGLLRPPLRAGVRRTVDRCTAAWQTIRDTAVGLSAKEFALLHTIAGEPMRVFTKEELLREVWGFKLIGTSRRGPLICASAFTRRRKCTNRGLMHLSRWLAKARDRRGIRQLTCSASPIPDDAPVTGATCPVSTAISYSSDPKSGLRTRRRAFAPSFLSSSG